MTNKSAQMTWRSRLTVVISLGLTVAAAACGRLVDMATGSNGVSPSSLAASGQNNGQDTKHFSVTITPISVLEGDATLQVTVTREATSGQSQQLGSVEIYVPSGFTIKSVSNISNANWTSGVSGQTVRVGAVGGNRKLDGATGRISVKFDINVTSAQCATHLFTAKASNSPYAETFDPNWTDIGSALSVTVTGCAVQECKAAPAVANEYLDSIDFTGGGGKNGLKRGDIIDAVAHEMTQGARFEGLDKCDPAYRTAVIAFVDELLKN